MKTYGKPGLIIIAPIIFLTVSALFITSPPILNAHSVEKGEVPVYGYRVINSYPHDPDAFTQGLLYDNGTLYESTGLNGRSTLREVNIKTGEVIRSRSLPAKYFGEGIAAVSNKIVQLTWRSKSGFVYDKRSFKVLKRFHYTGEGWGITYDGRNLIMSDGTDTLRFLDPSTFKTVGQLEVYSDRGKVGKLNELEYVEGEIFANVWGEERMARIDPKTGRVTGWIDLSGILGAEDRKKKVDVLNGIAYDTENKRLFVTGKLWPKLFEIEIVPKNTGE